MKRFNEFMIETNDSEFYICGTLTTDVDFVCKTKSGAYITPILYEDKVFAYDQIWSYENGILVAKPTEKATAVVSSKLKLPTIAVNKAGGTQFVTFISFGNDALAFIKNNETWESVKKGTQIVCLGTRCSLTIGGTTIDTLKLRNVLPVRQTNSFQQELM